MEKLKILTIALFLNLMLMILSPGCSSRYDEPVTEADSTIVFIPKNGNDISAKILLYRKISRKTGQPIDAGTVFPIRKKETVRALVELANRFEKGNRNLIFHFNWIGPDGSSVYTKPVNLSPGDSASTLSSSISISPETRPAGEYRLQLYLFRELIAEKKFQLIAESKDTMSAMEAITAKIGFCGKTDKKTGKRLNVDSVFKIRENGRVHAFVDIGNRFAYSGKELKFDLEWFGPDGKSFYHKQFDLSLNDSSTVLKNSISIDPDARQPGEYLLKLFLFHELIAENKFNLLPEARVISPIKKKITSKITFCSGVDKKTGEQIGVDTVFKIGDKGRIHAFVEFENREETKSELKFILDWVDPNGKSFYRKPIGLLPTDSISTVTSSISVSPETRHAGGYFLRVFLLDDLIGERKFELLP